MDDLLEILVKPIAFLFRWLFRIIFYIVVEVLHEYIAWSVGWCFFRVVTIGHYPKQSIWHDEKASIYTAVVVSLTGFVLITLFIIALMIF